MGRRKRRRTDPTHERDMEAVVTLHEWGWSDKSIARYLRVDRSTVWRVRRRFQEEGRAGLEDGPGGRPRGVARVALRAMIEVRKMRETPSSGRSGSALPWSNWASLSAGPVLGEPSPGGGRRRAVRRARARRLPGLPYVPGLVANGLVCWWFGGIFRQHVWPDIPPEHRRILMAIRDLILMKGPDR